jgi:2-oxoglutarate dehydrogenase complex dehydrogenase (E1) component-like enzyme
MRILSDESEVPDAKVRRLVLCSGKVAYDLMEKRDAEKLDDVSIVRLEQLYPFPGEPLAVRLKRMTGLKEVVWCQEEPKNNGAWFFVESRIEDALTGAGHKGMRPRYAGRDAAASPATGFAARHRPAGSARRRCAGHRQPQEISLPPGARSPQGPRSWPPKSKSPRWVNPLPKPRLANG